MRRIVVASSMACVAGCGGSTRPDAQVVSLGTPATRTPAAARVTSGEANVSADADTRDAAVANPPGPDVALLASVREISPTEHAVNAHALALLLGDEHTLLQLTRIVPDPPRGMRLFGIRPDALLGRLGFQNGDRVERLMGQPTPTIEQTQAAFPSMRGASVIVVDVDRQGVKERLTIRAE